MRKAPLLLSASGLAVYIVVVLISDINIHLQSKLIFKYGYVMDNYSGRIHTVTDSKTCEIYYASIGSARPRSVRGQLSTVIAKSADKSSPTHSQNRKPFVPLRSEDVNSVKGFVFFIGYARSGHSIVGSLLDAHPNIIIAHEFNLFRVWSAKEGKKLSNQMYLYNQLYANSYYNALTGWRARTKQQKGYSLDIDSKWQGAFDKLLIVGDKSGGVTTQVYKHSQEIFTSILDELKETVGIPIKVIHVVRNPYDILSTRLLYADSERGSKSKMEATTEEKYCNIVNLRNQMNRTIALVNTVHSFIHNSSLSILDVHLVDLIQDPDHVINNICTFLGVPCPRNYLDTCAQKVFKKVPRTRELVVWPEDLVNKVYVELIKPFSFFWRYSFTGN